MSSVLERYADRYSQHWHRVHTELLGIDAALFDGGFHDAPCCGASAAFKASNTAAGPVLTCHNCGGADNKGGPLSNIDLVAKRLKVSRDNAWQRVNVFLGFEQSKPKSASASRRDLSDTLARASGRWPSILAAVGGISADHLTGKHGPCPFCGGRDRWRWDDHDNNGGGYCNKCGGPDQQGGAISGLDLIARARGITFPEAIAMVDEYIGGSQVASAPRAARPMGHRTPERPPADAAPPDLGRATHQWLYSDAQGPCYWIQRIPMTGEPDKRGKVRKLFLHRVWLDGKWHRPNRKRDGWSCDWPAPRPLLGFVELQSRPDAPVLVVEGETTRDAAQALLPDWVVVTWSNGSNSVGMVDWSPLSGRRVVIWPDADTDGAKAAKRITQLVQASGATSVAIVAVPDGVTAGWDLGDAAAEGWDAARVLEHIEAALPPKEKPPSARAKRAERLLSAAGDGGDSGVPGTAPGRDRPFTLLGFAGDDFYYQPDASGQITVIHRARHTSTQLNGLARLAWWMNTYPMLDAKGKTIGIDWAMAVDDLFAKQYETGYFDPDKVRGLGAWWDEGRTVLHLGDRLIVNGAVHYLTRPFASEYIYQRLRRLAGPKDAKPLTSAEAMQVLEVASSFMWEESSSAFLLAGWIVLAPICGALRWRPHIWMTAGPGSGKSTIIERFVNVLIGDMGVHPEGAATEASIRQDLMSSALPIVYDEADPNEKSDRMRIQNILSFARSCSSEGRGRIMKGSSDQSGAKKYQPKSMFLLSSVSTALKQGADKSRFAQLTLRRDDNQTAAQQAAHWKQLDQVLREVITDEFALRLIARTINLIPVIRDAANVFAVAAAEHLGSQRLGDQYGALAAGAWSLCHERPPTPEEAAQWFVERPLTTYAEATEVPDEKSCLQTILEHQIRVDVESGTKAATVLELIRIAAGGRDEPQRKVAAALGGGPDSSQEAQHREITDEIAARSLGQIGVKVIEGDGQAPRRLAISYTAKGLRKVLADTSWELCWPTALARMEGATKGHQVWFKGIGNSRAVQLPMPELTDPPA